MTSHSWCLQKKKKQEHFYHRIKFCILQSWFNFTAPHMLPLCPQYWSLSTEAGISSEHHWTWPPKNKNHKHCTKRSEEIPQSYNEKRSWKDGQKEGARTPRLPWSTTPTIYHSWVHDKVPKSTAFFLLPLLEVMVSIKLISPDDWAPTPNHWGSLDTDIASKVNLLFLYLLFKVSHWTMEWNQGFHVQMFFKSAPQPLVFWEETTHMMFKASMLKDHYWQCWQTICSARDRIQVGYVQGKFLSAMLSLEPILLFLFDCLFVWGGGHTH